MVVGTARLSARSPSVLLALLRVGSIRYSAFYFVAYYGGLAATGADSLAWAGAAWFFSITVCLAVELLNRYTDQREDKINNPQRTAICELVGYERIKRTAISLLVLLVPIGAAWLWMWNNIQLACLQFLVLLLAVNYSWGLRLKAKRYAVYVALSGTFLLPYLVGWGTFQPFWEIPREMLIVPLFIASIAGIKDLTDVAGDHAVGYRSAFVELALAGGRWLVVLSLAPHVVMTAFVVLGVVPPRMLATLVFVPVSLALLRMAPAAMRRGERGVLRELTYHAWFAYIAMSLILSSPTPAMIVGAGSAAVFWVVASQWLHWTRGFRWREVRALIQVAQS